MFIDFHLFNYFLFKNHICCLSCGAIFLYGVICNEFVMLIFFKVIVITQFSYSVLVFVGNLY